MNVLAALLQLVERHDNPQTAHATWLAQLLRQYFATEERPYSYHTLLHHLPYIDEGEMIGFQLDHYRQWARIRDQETARLDRALCMAVVRDLGFLGQRLTAREDNKVCCRYYWTQQAAFLQESAM